MRYSWLLVFVGAVCSSTLRAEQPAALFQRAIDEYRAAMDSIDREVRLQRFHRAELLFEKLVSRAEESGQGATEQLYTNLGNAALGGERLGVAVLSFRRALRLDPDHAQAASNLQHARSLLPDWVPRPEEAPWFDSFFGWSRRLSAVELQLAAGFAFVLAAGLLAAAIRLRKVMLRNLAVLPAIVWLVLLAALWMGAARQRVPAAVVVTPDAVARSADSSNAPMRFGQSLPAGTEVTVIENREDWVKVKLFDGREAWLLASAIELV